MVNDFDFEPVALTTCASLEVAGVSQAVSLKRIADALEFLVSLKKNHLDTLRNVDLEKVEKALEAMRAAEHRQNTRRTLRSQTFPYTDDL